MNFLRALFNPQPSWYALYLTRIWRDTKNAK